MEYTLAHAIKINDSIGREELCNHQTTSYKIDSVYKYEDRKGRKHCSYCGSVSPNDLRKLISEGASIELADQKYGWPHKFYISFNGELLKFYSLHLKDAITSFSYWDIRRDLALYTGVHLEVDEQGFITYYEALHE